MVFDVTYIWIYPRIFIHPRDRARARESGIVSPNMLPHTLDSAMNTPNQRIRAREEFCGMLHTFYTL